MVGGDALDDFIDVLEFEEDPDHLGAYRMFRIRFKRNHATTHSIYLQPTQVLALRKALNGLTSVNNLERMMARG